MHPKAYNIIRVAPAAYPTNNGFKKVKEDKLSENKQVVITSTAYEAETFA